MGKQEAKTETHPSYGLASIGRMNGGFNLFESDVEHPHCIYLRVHRAEKKWDLCRSWLYDREPLIEIRMSASQFAHLITSSNSDSTPCTIHSVGRERMEPFQPDQTERDRYNQDIKDSLSGLVKTVKNGLQKARAIKEKKSVAKSDITELESLLSGLLTEIGSNLPFIEESFREALETQVNNAKLEFEAYVDHSLQRRGLEAFKNDVPRMRESNTPELEASINE